MTPAELVREWIKRFNAADIDGLAELYAPYAVNHQVAQARVWTKDEVSPVVTDPVKYSVN